MTTPKTDPLLAFRLGASAGTVAGEWRPAMTYHHDLRYADRSLVPDFRAPRRDLRPVWSDGFIAIVRTPTEHRLHHHEGGAPGCPVGLSNSYRVLTPAEVDELTGGAQ